MARADEEHLAPYAIQSCDASLREHPEVDDPLRSPFELDRHRIIESTAFRRLEGKTQVFIVTHNDHFRTRLTHTFEAAQIARCLAAALHANEGLTEAITLAHDLGHPPFGHSGESALDESMKPHGGFNHNLHALRVVEFLEHPFPPFRGLNLTVETRAGLSTHATRYDTPAEESTDATNAPTPTRAAGFSPREHTNTKGRSPSNDTPILRTGASVEAQIASVADRIAYNCHDLEDAIGAGFIDLSQLATVQLWQKAFDRAMHDYAQPGGPSLQRRRTRLGDSHHSPTSEDVGHPIPDSADAGHPTHHSPTSRDVGHPTATNIHAIRRAVLDSMLNALLTDVIQTSQELLANVPSPADAKASETLLVRFSDTVDDQLGELESFLAERVYRHPQVIEMDVRGRETIAALFTAYRAKPDAMPARFFARIDDLGLERVICDYIAGMTDLYCMREHARVVCKSA